MKLKSKILFGILGGGVLLTTPLITLASCQSEDSSSTNANTFLAPNKIIAGVQGFEGETSNPTTENNSIIKYNNLSISVTSSSASNKFIKIVLPTTIGENQFEGFKGFSKDAKISWSTKSKQLNLSDNVITNDTPLDNEAVSSEFIGNISEEIATPNGKEIKTKSFNIIVEFNSFEHNEWKELNQIAEQATFIVNDKEKWSDSINDSNKNLIIWNEKDNYPNLNFEINNISGNKETGNLIFDFNISNQNSLKSNNFHKEIQGFWTYEQAINELIKTNSFYLKNIYEKPTTEDLNSILNWTLEENNKYNLLINTDIEFEYSNININEEKRELSFDYSIKMKNNNLIKSQTSTSIVGWGTKQEIINDIFEIATFAPNDPSYDISNINDNNAWLKINWLEDKKNNKYGLEWGAYDGNVSTYFSEVSPDPSKGTVRVTIQFGWRNQDIKSGTRKIIIEGWNKV